MGKASDSFKREIGKNTGKAVSNFIFGDKHSTPVKLIRDVKRERLEEKYKLEDELQRKKHQAELKERENQIYLAFKKDINSKILYTSSFEIPDEEKELTQFLNEIKSNLYLNNWKLFLSTSLIGIKQNNLNNKLANSLFNKYKEGVDKLETNYPKNTQISNFKKSIKSNKFKKIFIQYWIILIPMAIFILLLLAAITEQIIRSF
jgi:hypothetical protein